MWTRFLCCPTCRMLALTISSLADKYAGKVTVCKVNLDRVPGIAQKYGVMTIPTVPIIKDGKEVKPMIGLRETLSQTIFWAIDRIQIDGWSCERIKVQLALP